MLIIMIIQDPFTLKSGKYLRELFPNSKFLFMVRDGRATVHSIISRKVTITGSEKCIGQLNKDFTNLLRFAGFDLKSYRQCLTKWNAAISAMNDECKALGPKHCLPVIYEQMVLHPEQWLRKISNFLEVPWNDAVIHHEEQINKKGGISLSKVERSSDQVDPI